ncbi:hypothetical protein VULLAG_LOCUS17989 [Vulpes lagopus]
MVRALSGLARPRRAAASILREETLGPRDARGIGLKLCGAGEEAGPGVRRPGPRRPPPPSPHSAAQTRPQPPPSSRALPARPLAGSSSLARPRPRPAQLGQSHRGVSARPPGLRLPGPRPAPPPRPPRARRLPPGPRPPAAAPRSHHARGPAARRGTRRDLAAPRPAPGEPRGSSGGR